MNKQSGHILNNFKPHFFSDKYRDLLKSFIAAQDWAHTKEYALEGDTPPIKVVFDECTVGLEIDADFVECATEGEPMPTLGKFLDAVNFIFSEYYDMDIATCMMREYYIKEENHIPEHYLMSITIINYQS